MTAPAPAPGRPVTPAGRRRALVQQIAADPALIEWLRGHVADQLDHVAAAVEASEPPTVEVAAAAVRTRASAHRRGDTALW